MLVEAVTKEAVRQGKRWVGRGEEGGVEIEKDDGCQQSEAMKVFFLLWFDRFSCGTTPQDTVEVDHRETGVGVFKLPSCSFAGSSAGGGHRKNGRRSESVGD